VATHVAARNRTFFLITLGAAVVITILTAGIGFATLALPIYRFTLFRTAAHQRDAAWRQVRELEGAAPVQPQPALPAPALPLASRAEVQPAPNAPTVSAGVLPAFTAAELDPWIPSDARYRRAGWALLLISLILAASGVVAIVASLTLPLDPADASLSSLLEDSVLSLSGLACLAAAALGVAGALLVGAVAAFRRQRIGWGIAILTIGVLGIVCGLVPAYVTVLAYLVAMPSTPGKAALDPTHMLQASN
jgi:hypothetical protein